MSVPASFSVGPVDLRRALKEAMTQLGEAGVGSPTLAAELLLMHVLGCDRAWLYAHPEAPLAADLAARYFDLVARRIAGTPTQYLVGRQEFWGLEMEVTPDVLIPRPETEHLVEVALERLGQNRSQKTLLIADVGTGSGCLAVALAAELPSARVFASDVSQAALEVARRNAARHGVAGRIGFVRASLLEPFASARLDLVVSNPPYVARSEAELLPREVREHEPPEALFAGPEGGEIYRPLIAQAARALAPGGFFVVELGYGAAPAAFSLIEAAGEWTRITVTSDLAGIPRVLAAERRKI
jgi:release factor glutamine methyltransferase